MSGRTDDATDSHDRDRTATRRRTLLALGGAVLGAAGYGYGVAPNGVRSPLAGARDGERSMTPARIVTLTALAEAVYPPTVDVDRDFVERRIVDRVEPQPGHFDGLVAAIDAVDGRARARFGAPVEVLSVDDRRRVLRSMGVTAVHPAPDGTTAERVRYYLINDLLFALLTSPISSDLTGIENPPGHPGGREAYRRGPDTS